VALCDTLNLLSDAVRALRELGIKTSVISNGDPRISKLHAGEELSGPTDACSSRHIGHFRNLAVFDVSANDFVDSGSFQAFPTYLPNSMPRC
jgi:hypothetical protein